jgi:hypothetical protein
MQPATAAAAAGLLAGMGRSLQSDLRQSDRALWPALIAGYKPGGTKLFTSGRRQPILYSGSLTSYDQRFGPPDLARAISTGCSAVLARDTWLIVDGPVTSPALQGEVLFLVRDGHLLMYYAQ